MTGGNKHYSITLAGFMGVGKSTVGRLVAEQLGFDFVDTDTVIQARAGRTIAEIFEAEGEDYFRQLEAAACEDTVAGCDRVIAVGGGALVNFAVQTMMEARSLVICLTCDIDAIIRRVGDVPGRPLFSVDREKLAQLFARRADHYASLPYHIDTTPLSPERVAEEVIRIWQQHR